MTARRGSVGTATGGMEYSPETLIRMNRARERQESRWARMAGKMTVSQITPEQEKRLAELRSRQAIRSKAARYEKRILRALAARLPVMRNVT